MAIDMQKIVNLVQNGQTIQAIKVLRDGVEVNDDGRANLKYCKDVIDCIGDLLGRAKNNRPDIIERVMYDTDQGLYWQAWNNLKSWTQGQIDMEIEVHVNRYVTKLFRRLIRKHTQRITRQS